MHLILLRSSHEQKKGLGTRVPIKYLWEYLLKGKTLEAFLDDFEGVPREEAIAALEQGYERLLEGLPRP